MLTPFAREILTRQRDSLQSFLDSHREQLKNAVEYANRLQGDVRETENQISELNATLNAEVVDL